MTTSERALQLWQILISAAHNRQVLTYEIAAKRIGLVSRGLGNHLGHIMRYCERNRLPPLTVLIVKKGGGRPGDGLTTAANPDEARERVFAHNWFAMKPPTADDFRQA
jgi:hypothetical protein